MCVLDWMRSPAPAGGPCPWIYHVLALRVPSVEASSALQHFRKLSQLAEDLVFFILLDPPGDPGENSLSSILVHVRLCTSFCPSALTSPLRLSQHRGLAGLLQPSPIRFGQEGEIATLRRMLHVGWVGLSWPLWSH